MRGAQSGLQKRKEKCGGGTLNHREVEVEQLGTAFWWCGSRREGKGFNRDRVRVGDQPSGAKTSRAGT